METPPLIAAVKRQNYKSVEDLVLAGAAVDAADDTGATALMFACLSGHYRIAELLIAHGADVNARDDAGSAPVNWAAWGGGADTLSLLFSHGADIETRDADGNTPLMGAALGGRPAPRYRETVRMLLARGASLDNRNNNGQAAEDVAVDDQMRGIIETARAARIAEKSRKDAETAALKQRALRARAARLKPGAP